MKEQLDKIIHHAEGLRDALSEPVIATQVVQEDKPLVDNMAKARAAKAAKAAKAKRKPYKLKKKPGPKVGFKKGIKETPIKGAMGDFDRSQAYLKKRGNLLRLERVSHDWNLTHAAIKSQVSASTISRLENGLDVTHAGDYINKLAKAYKVDTNTFRPYAGKYAKQVKRKAERIKRAEARASRK